MPGDHQRRHAAGGTVPRGKQQVLRAGDGADGELRHREGAQGAVQGAQGLRGRALAARVQVAGHVSALTVRVR